MPTDNSEPLPTIPLRTLTVNARLVGYRVVDAHDPADRCSAIVYFYPLSGSSMVLDKLSSALGRYRCSILCVDRPGIAPTSALANNATKRNVGPVADDVHRIKGHSQDVIAVLRRLNISKVYLLGVCLGHPFAIQVARDIRNDSGIAIEIMGITLVAPFVSPACPMSWKVSRFGANFPKCIVETVTHAMHGSTSLLVPIILTPKRVKGLFHSEEIDIGGWTEKDFEDLCEMAKQNVQGNSEARSVEAWLGTSSNWQYEVCDKFAMEMGVFNAEETKEHDAASSKVSNEKATPFPIRIHASSHDKVATFDSVRWISRRCYGWNNKVTEYPHVEKVDDDVGTTALIRETQFYSHEILTFLGGPMHNPVLLHRIAREWKLLDT